MGAHLEIQVQAAPGPGSTGSLKTPKRCSLQVFRQELRVWLCTLHSQPAKAKLFEEGKDRSLETKNGMSEISQQKGQIYSAMALRSI